MVQVRSPRSASRWPLVLVGFLMLTSVLRPAEARDSERTLPSGASDADSAQAPQVVVPDLFTDVISREISVFVPPPLLSISDAISREVSVFEPFPPVELTDTNSREMSAFVVIPLTLGTPFEGTIAPGQYLYFRVTTPPDLTLRIDLDHDSTTAWTELYASFGHVPDTFNAEFSSESPGQPDQELVVPNTQAGTYYILARCTTDSNASASKNFHLLAASVPFGVDGVQPPTVGAGEEVTLRVTGGHLDSASSIRLHPSDGGTDITPIKTTLADAAHARLRCNLSGAPLGTYDVVCEREGAPARVLAHAVTVESPDEVTQDTLAISVVGVPGIRHGGTGPGTITLTNTSNVDAPITQVTFVSLYDSEITITVGTAPGIVLAGTTEYRWAESWFENLGPGESVVVPFAIKLGRDPEIDPIPLYVQQTVFTREQFRGGFLVHIIDRELDVLRQEPQWDPSFETAFVPEYTRLIVDAFDTGGLRGLGLPTVDPRLGGSETALGSVYIPSSTQLDCKDFCDKIKNDCLFGCVVGLIEPPLAVACAAGCYLAYSSCIGCCNNPCRCWRNNCPNQEKCDYSCDIGGKCPEQCMPRVLPWCPAECEQDHISDDCVGLCTKWECKQGPCFDGPLVWDPNEKFTSLGFGDQRYVANRSEISYEISFENLPEAQAPAAIVKISDPIDPALDLATFRLGRIYFGSTTIDVPPARTSFGTRLDMLATYGVLVDVSAGIDTVRRTAWWDIQALDPETMQVPANAYVGFLPPEDGTGVGQGGVAFSIAPRAGQPSGVLVHNKASIIFDYNDPIETNEVSNTIDAVAPTSAVAALPPKVTHGRFDVCWAGQDDPGGSGVANYEVFVSDADGPYATWLANGEARCSAFNGGAVGHMYRFYSLARDNVGYVEATPTDPQSGAIIPDATTTVRFGDFNGDGVADQSDFYQSGQQRFWSCLTPPSLSARCATNDIDFDGDVDLLDFAAFQNDFTGLPDYQQVHSCLTAPAFGLPTECDAEDFDLDGDVDLRDFASFQIEFGGSQ